MFNKFPIFAEKNIEIMVCLKNNNLRVEICINPLNEKDHLSASKPLTQNGTNYFHQKSFSFIEEKNLVDKITKKVF